MTVYPLGDKPGGPEVRTPRMILASPPSYVHMGEPDWPVNDRQSKKDMGASSGITPLQVCVYMGQLARLFASMQRSPAQLAQCHRENDVRDLTVSSNMTVR